MQDPQQHQNQAPNDVAIRTTKNYDPRTRMTKIKGQWYLEVKHRIAWLRAEYPISRISTEVVALAPRAVIRATIVAIDEQGNEHGTGSGIGSCTPDEFDAYVEKAETKALGRAAASLGYGTQFSLEYDDAAGAEHNMSQLADAPVSAPQPGDNNAPIPMQRPQGSQQAAPRQQSGYQGGGYQGNGQSNGGGQAPGGYPLASSAQKGMIAARIREAGLTEHDVAAYIKQHFNADLDTLGKRDASRLIDALGAGEVPRGPGGGAHAAEEQAQAAYAAGGYDSNLSDVPF